MFLENPLQSAHARDLRSRPIVPLRQGRTISQAGDRGDGRGQSRRNARRLPSIRPGQHRQACQRRYDVVRKGRYVEVTGEVERHDRADLRGDARAFRVHVKEQVDLRFTEPRFIDEEAATGAEPEVDLDAPDPIENGRIDLGVLTAEYLVPGAGSVSAQAGRAFTPLLESEPEPSPFAKLAHLSPSRNDEERTRNPVASHNRSAIVRRPSRGQAARAAPLCQEGSCRSAMTRKVRISLDAMGGDFGPAVVYPGSRDRLGATSRQRLRDPWARGRVPSAARQASQRSRRSRRFTTLKLPSGWMPSRARRCGRGDASRPCGAPSNR